MEIEENVKKEEPVVEAPVKKRRGRKPSKDKKNNMYFSDKEEEAVVLYICSDDKEEKERIYNSILRPAFEKMVESIIRRYKLYVPNEESGDTYHDAMSYLMTKVEKFDCGRNKKAYSYYGNITKNYIISRIQLFNKLLVRNPSYDSPDSEYNFAEDCRYITEDNEGAKTAALIVEKIKNRFKTMSNNPDDYSLKEVEVSLAKALVNLLENWEFVLSTDGSNKLNKNAILFFLREQTGLDTKGIRDNMKKFKKEFLLIKDAVIRD